MSLQNFRDVFLPQRKYFPPFLSTESKAEFTYQRLSMNYLMKEAGLHQIVLRPCAALIRQQYPHRQGECKWIPLEWLEVEKRRRSKTEHIAVEGLLSLSWKTEILLCFFNSHFSVSLSLCLSFSPASPPP